MDLEWLKKIIPFLSNIYENNSAVTSRDYALCRRYARYSRTIMITLFITYSIATFLLQLPKFVKYLMTGVMEPSVNVYFPRVDALGGFNEVWTHTFNFSISPISIAVMYTLDAVIYLFFVNLTMIPNLLEGDLLELKGILEKPKTSQKDIKSKLVNIIQFHRKYNE